MEKERWRVRKKAAASQQESPPWRTASAAPDLVHRVPDPECGKGGHCPESASVQEGAYPKKFSGPWMWQPVSSGS